jgi:glycosyltransferase involved in cell wall biosynthesis/SAM-dependent methyltransferase
MHDTPLVSTIIIFLNAERYIEEAIESVFAQSYRNWELLLVDDGSTDRSSAIARRYAREHPERVRYLEHEGHRNRGMSASRNLGIQNARGDLIAFLDADDVWLPHKLERQVGLMQAHPEVGMVYGRSQWWYSWTGNPEEQDKDYVHQLGVPSETPQRPPALLSAFFFRQSATLPNPTNIMLRRQSLEQVGGFEEQFGGMYEDQALISKIVLAAPVLPVDECWDRYRQHSASCVAEASSAGKEHAARLYFMTWLARYLSTRGIGNPRIRWELQKQIWAQKYPALLPIRARAGALAHQARRFPVRLAGRVLPVPVRRWILNRLRGPAYTPSTGTVHFGDLRRLRPISEVWGYDRGEPVDRHYIEGFLSEHAADIKGRVLEVADNSYTRRFGGERVTTSDVLHAEADNPEATIVADLTRGEGIPSHAFDCVVLTQTLQFIYDVPAALRTVHRILKPGGVALVTVPGISQISRYDMDNWGHFWSFTSLSARLLVEEAFPGATVEIKTYGNVLTTAAFLYGLASGELRQAELDHHDRDYEMIIAVRVRKAEQP